MSLEDDAHRVLEASREDKRTSRPKMACPDCGSRLSAVLEGRDIPDGYQRIRQCACGRRFVTEERFVRKVRHAKKNPDMGMSA